MDKRIFRSRNDSVISGVCGGIAEYFVVDPSLVRIAVVILTLATGGLGIIAYLVCALVIPLRPIGEEPSSGFAETGKEGANGYSDKGNKTLGGVLIFLGLFFMAKKLFWWIDFWMIAPIICIIVGIMIINKGRGA